MFFKDIDSWTKKKLYLFIVLFGSLYFIVATLVPVIIVAINYDLFGKGNYRLTAAGIIVVIFLLTSGRKAFHWVISIMPQETQKQQIVRYSVELIAGLIIPAVAIWVIHLFKVNMELAANTATACIISMIVAIVIDNLFLKTLRYQVQCLNEVGHKDKIERIQKAQNKE